jgi:hypothetical protein
MGNAGAVVTCDDDRCRVACWQEAGLIFVAASALLILFQIYLQNVHITTTNGLWKSVGVRSWISDPGWRRIDFANVLYFPVQALSCCVLEAFGVFPHQIWRQLAILNGLAGGAGAAAVYVFTLRWLGSHTAALFTTVLYAGTGFYLLLSVINEDIMPGAVLVLISTLLACAWFARATAARIACVAILFSLGWLWEWRLIFPALPAMLLALFLAAGSWRQRAGRPLFFLLAMSCMPAGLTMLYWASHHGGPPTVADFAVRLYWAGKGLGTGWGGFSAHKLMFCLVGMDQSLFGAQNVSVWGIWLTYPKIAWETGIGSLLLLGLSAMAIIYAWGRRRDPTIFTSTVLLGGTFVAGTVFNLYSQPQDPQMVINVMLWTIPALGLVANAILSAPERGPFSRFWRVPATVVLALAVLLPDAYNANALAVQRGDDAANEGLVARLAARFDPARTVFLQQGFEGILTWEFVIWGGDPTGWFADSELPPASTAEQSLKYISATRALVIHPDWSAGAVADDLKREIDLAMDRGYEVVAAPIYLASDHTWVSSFATLKNASTAEAMREMMRTNYRLVRVFSDPVGGTYSSVVRRVSP